MSLPTFGQLLVEYMSRSGISDSELARSIGVRRQTIFRWKEGLVERPRSREDVLQCAKKLRLTDAERDRLLLAAGFAPEQLTSVVLNPQSLDTAASPSETAPAQILSLPAQPDALPAEAQSEATADSAEKEIVADPASTPPLVSTLLDMPVVPGSSPLVPLVKDAVKDAPVPDEPVVVVAAPGPTASAAAPPTTALPPLLTALQRRFVAGGLLVLALLAFLWTRNAPFITTPTPTSLPRATIVLDPPPQTTPTNLPTPVVAADGETLLLIAQFKGYTPNTVYNVAGRISGELQQQITAAGLLSTTVSNWPAEISDGTSARQLLTAANATMVIWGEYDSGRVLVNLEARDAKESKSLPFTLTPGDELVTTINAVVPKEIRDTALLALASLATDRAKYQIDIARRLRDLGNVSAAAAVFQQALERAPDDAENAALLNFYLGYLTAKTKKLSDYELAITYYNRALTLDPQLYDALYNRGTIQIERGQKAPANEALILESLNAAIADLTAFIKVRPNDPNGYFNRSVAYYERDGADDMTAALADLDHVLAVNPNYTLAYFQRGLVHIRAGQSDQWIADFQQMLALNPDDVRPVSGLCWGYVMAQQAEKALPYCDQAVQEDTTGASNDSRAIAYAQLRRYPEAITDFRTYLDSLKAQGSILTYERGRGPLVEQWITQLEAGQNPFDSALLEKLRHRDHY